MTGMRQPSYHTLSNNILGLLLQVVTDPRKSAWFMQGPLSVFKMTASQYMEGLFVFIGNILSDSQEVTPFGGGSCCWFHSDLPELL